MAQQVDRTGIDLEDPFGDVPAGQEIVGVESLRFDPKNARKHTKANLDVLQRSIEDTGVWRSIAIDENNTILAGNATVEVAGQLGIERVRIIEADGEEIIAVRRRGLTEDQKRRYGMFDNRASELAEWDIEQLAEFAADEQDFSGIFSDNELAKLLSETTEVGDQAAEADAQNIGPGREAISRPGDLYFLGEHMLLCGDCRNSADVDRLLDGVGGGVDLIFTDPPYNVSYVGKTEEKLEINNDKQNDEDFEQFLMDAFSQMWMALKPGGVYYCCHPGGPLSEMFYRTLRNNHLAVRQQIIWAKNSLVMGHSDFHYRHEPIAYGWKDGAHYHCGDRSLDTLWEIDRPSASRDHPTMKPTALVTNALTYSSRPGDVVYDPFGGSGTTLLACEVIQPSRQARLMEIDPIYCDVIIRRFSDLTGKEVRRVRDDAGVEPMDGA